MRDIDAHEVLLELCVNEERRITAVRPADTLLDTVREKLGLTGAKPGCKNGDCGTCTILVDGWPMKSCLMLAVEAAGRKVTTIEGLNNTRIQRAFIENWAFQCGYCTPGFIMNCQGLIQNHPNASREMIKDWLQSNICRCTGYREIEEAVISVLLGKGG
jgi:aerobic carbon-monoxide dehydrogenase small subunit